MDNTEKNQKERIVAMKNLNMILQIEREFEEFYGSWLAIEDIRAFQKMTKELHGISEYLEETENRNLNHCDAMLKVVKGLHDLAMEKQYLLYNEITQLVQIIVDDLSVCISEMKTKCIEKFCEFR